MKNEFSTILIIPCYNEEKRLDIPYYSQFLKDNSDFFLLFVNDGSSDNTQNTLQTLISSKSNCSVLSLSKNLGKGEAVRQGVLYSLDNYSFDLIGFADADISTPLEEFEVFKSRMNNEKKIRIVLGSRVQMLGKKITRNLFRHWFGRIIATGIGKVINEPVYDSQCGAKLFDKEIARELFQEAFISKWLFDVELLSRYKRRYGSEAFNCTIIEVPVNQWIEKQDSKLRYHYLFRIMYDLFRIRHKYFRSK